MRKKTVAIILLITFITLCWGFIVAIKWTDKMVYVYAHDFESSPGIRLMDPNHAIFEIISHETKRVNVKWEKTEIHHQGRCRVKMRENSPNVQVLAEVNDGKIYPVVIDSGATKYLAATDSLVLDAGLEIYPIYELGKNIGGLCYIEQLKIGTLTIVHPACEYWLAHYERRVLGHTIWKEKKLNLGLNLMKEFSYILFDNVTREVEFATNTSFNPQDSNQWHQYPMAIERDEKQYARLMVDIPLVGQTQRIEFDTGAAPGLILTESIWKQFSSDLQIHHQKKELLATPLSGWLPCRQITVEQLTLGNILINDARIHVIADDNPFGRDEFTLGTGFFKETVIVLDFERNILWAKNPLQSSSF
ncbi:MAG: hypothetical protein GY774_14315 [Planctomycetes bacterium]|nr:hypothetical protein [Planctomycetota bacterium]